MYLQILGKREYCTVGSFCRTSISCLLLIDHVVQGPDVPDQLVKLAKVMIHADFKLCHMLWQRITVCALIGKFHVET